MKSQRLRKFAKQQTMASRRRSLHVFHARTLKQLKDGTLRGPRNLVISDCTIRLRIVRARIGLITRRVGISSHTQSSLYGEDGFIERASCGSAGNRKRGEGRATYKGGGHVIADHEPLGSIGEPGKRHRSSKLRIGTPRRSTIRRGREPHLQLTGGGGAVRIRVEVEDDCQFSRTPGG